MGRASGVGVTMAVRGRAGSGHTESDAAFKGAQLVVRWSCTHLQKMVLDDIADDAIFVEISASTLGTKVLAKYHLQTQGDVASSAVVQNSTRILSSARVICCRHCTAR